MATEVAIAEIVTNGRHRKDMGELDGLCRSIEEVGLLQPIVLGPGQKLIAGRRRIAAFKKLGRDKIPAVILKRLSEAAISLKAERDENICRKDFTPSEAVAIGRALEELEKPNAKERQSMAGPSHGQGHKSASVNFTEPAVTGSTRDIVGNAVGMSGPTYNRAKAVVEAAESDPETFGAIAEEMDRTGKIHPAYDRVMQLKGKANGETNEKPKPRRRTLAQGRPSAYEIKAALAALRQLEDALTRIGLTRSVVKPIETIRSEIENARD